MGVVLYLVCTFYVMRFKSVIIFDITFFNTRWFIGKQKIRFSMLINFSGQKVKVHPQMTALVFLSIMCKLPILPLGNGACPLFSKNLSISIKCKGEMIFHNRL